VTDDDWVLTSEPITDDMCPCLKPSHKKLEAELERVKKRAKADRDLLFKIGMMEINRLVAELEQVKKERDEAPSPEAFEYLAQLRERHVEQITALEAKARKLKAERDRLAEALRETLEAEGSEIPHNVAVRARAALASMEGDKPDHSPNHPSAGHPRCLICDEPDWMHPGASMEGDK